MCGNGSFFLAFQFQSGFSRCFFQGRVANRTSSHSRFLFVKIKEIDQAAAAEQAEQYFLAHPGSPSAIRRPQIGVRNGTWMALLGSNVRDGIVGFVQTVEAALRAFDAIYLNTLRPQSEAISFQQAA